MAPNVGQATKTLWSRFSQLSQRGGIKLLSVSSQQERGQVGRTQSVFNMKSPSYGADIDDILADLNSSQFDSEPSEPSRTSESTYAAGQSLLFNRTPSTVFGFPSARGSLFSQSMSGTRLPPSRHEIFRQQQSNFSTVAALGGMGVASKVAKAVVDDNKDHAKPSQRTKEEVTQSVDNFVDSMGKEWHIVFETSPTYESEVILSPTEYTALRNKSTQGVILGPKVNPGGRLQHAALQVDRKIISNKAKDAEDIVKNELQNVKDIKRTLKKNKFAAYAKANFFTDSQKTKLKEPLKTIERLEKAKNDGKELSTEEQKEFTKAVTECFIEMGYFEDFPEGDYTLDSAVDFIDKMTTDLKEIYDVYENSRERIKQKTVKEHGPKLIFIGLSLALLGWGIKEKSEEDKKVETEKAKVQRGANMHRIQGMQKRINRDLECFLRPNQSRDVTVDYIGDHADKLNEPNDNFIVDLRALLKSEENGSKTELKERIQKAPSKFSGDSIQEVFQNQFNPGTFEGNAETLVQSLFNLGEVCGIKNVLSKEKGKIDADRKKMHEAIDKHFEGDPDIQKLHAQVDRSMNFKFYQLALNLVLDQQKVLRQKTKMIVNDDSSSPLNEVYETFHNIGAAWIHLLERNVAPDLFEVMAVPDTGGIDQLQANFKPEHRKDLHNTSIEDSRLDES